MKKSTSLFFALFNKKNNSVYVQALFTILISYSLFSTAEAQVCKYAGYSFLNGVGFLTTDYKYDSQLSASEGLCNENGWPIIYPWPNDAYCEIPANTFPEYNFDLTQNAGSTQSCCEYDVGLDGSCIVSPPTVEFPPMKNLGDSSCPMNVQIGGDDS